MSDTETLRGRLLDFLAVEWARKANRQLSAVELLFVPGAGIRDEKIHSWLRADEPEFFAEFTNVEKLITQLIKIAECAARAKPPGKHRFVVRTLQHLGGRASHSFPLYVANDEHECSGSAKADTSALHRTIDAMASAIGPIIMDHVASERAHAEKLEAQVALVSKILELAQPTVRALGTRPKISETQTYDDGPITQHANWRGLVLTCPVKKIKPSGSEPCPTAVTAVQEGDTHAKGSYSGCHVFIRDDGALVELSYEGTLSVRRGGKDEWRATEQTISIEGFCRAWPQAADPKKLAEQLLGFMDASGNRDKATAKANDLIAKFRAITTLL